MSIQCDGDPIRGLGFVTLHASYLEEQIENLLHQLAPVEAYPEPEQRWQIGRKISKAIRLVEGLNFEYRNALLASLEQCRKLFEWRNEIVHGRIYAGSNDRPETLKSGRPGIPDRPIETAELDELANSLSDARLAILRPMLFQIPRALSEGSFT